MTLFDSEQEREPAGLMGPSVRVRMTVAYDGSAFHGFAAQPGTTTVAGALTLALTRAMRVEAVDLVCAGRTDSGVHARGQVVSFDAPAGVEVATLGRRINRQLAPKVVVRDAAVMDPSFDARRDALARRYRYTVLNAPVPDPLLAAHSWWVAEALDVRSMQAACDPLLGTHDFTSFCRRPEPWKDGTQPGRTRRVLDAEWVEEADGVLQFWIEANAFCHQMVRSIVGLLVEVGRGKRRVADVTRILNAADRSGGGADPAPPHALVLWEVRYS